MRILVTGSAGHLGEALVLLPRGRRPARRRGGRRDGLGKAALKERVGIWERPGA
jgi:hypothetical protein